MYALCCVLAVTHVGIPWKGHSIDLRVPYFFVLSFVLADWPNRKQKQSRVMVHSLDERAYLRYGKEYDQLDEERQKQILGRYRVGAYLFCPKVPAATAELLRKGKAKARVDAIRMVCVAVVPCLAVYAAGWFLLPQGALRNNWTNWPEDLIVAVLTIFTLPRLLWLWREPELDIRQRFDLPEWV